MIARDQGQSLIEAMIAVAIIGISVIAFAGSAAQLRRDAMNEVVQERALQCLEYEAAAISIGRAPDPETRARLLELLPGGRLEHRQSAIAVSWESDSGRHERTLTVARTGR